LLSGWLVSVPFALVHLMCLAVFLTGIGTLDVVLCGLFYFVRMFGITGGYHRYFSHRAYKTSRWFQFVLAWLGCSALQKGPLWWAGHHRGHHLYSDTEKDPHSPITGTIWHSHVGWIVAQKHEATDYKAIKDFAKFPELQWLNNWHWVPGIVLGTACFLIGGWSGLIVGFFISTVLLYHGTFCVNSLCHLFGKRRYETTDKSRNNALVALITLGEGWHNNHHHYQSSANQGFFWWEVDISYYILKVFEKCGLVWDLRKPPQNKLVPLKIEMPATEPNAS